MCPFSVERSYEGTGAAFDCVNPRFFDATDGEPGGYRAFDLRERGLGLAAASSAAASRYRSGACRGRGRPGPVPRAARAVP